MPDACSTCHSKMIAILTFIQYLKPMLASVMTSTKISKICVPFKISSILPLTPYALCKTVHICQIFVIERNIVNIVSFPKRGGGDVESGVYEFHEFCFKKFI